MFGGWALGLAVLVTVEGADHALSERVLSGCRAALGAADCSSSTSDAETSTLRARVRFEDGRVLVAVELVGATTLTRSLEFAPEDSPSQRAIAAGLLVAALSAELSADSERARSRALELTPPPPTPQPKLQSPLAPPATAGMPAQKPRAWLADVAMVGAPPAGDLAWQLGLDAQVVFWPVQWLGIGFGGRADTSTPGALDAGHLALRAGPEFELWGSRLRASPPLSGSVSLAVQLEQWRFGGGLSEPRQDTVTRFGALIGTRWALVVDQVGLFIGLEATLAGAKIEVMQGERLLGTVPALGFGLLLGGRLQAGGG